MADTNPSTLHSTAKAEFACPDCGEMVREGLVRCWNCGGFLRPEMEQKFQKMQEQPPKVILSSPTETDADDADLDSMMRSRSASAAGEEDDFQLSTPLKQAAAPTIEGGEAPAEAPESPAAEAGKQPAAGEQESAETPTQAGADQETTSASGDALLELAAAEEQEREKKQVGRGAGLEGVKAIRDGFLIDAPKGCRIQVRDERTGELRRLTFGASSRVRISMLDKLEAIAKARKEAAAKEAAGPKHLSAGKYQRWMSDLHLHTINPAKLKLVADSLTREFVPVEMGFAEDGLLVVSLPGGKKSLFGGKAASTPEEAREALLNHLRAGKSLEGDKVEVAGEVKNQYTADQVAELRVVQPAPSLSESLFAGIPVFGNGRIAVQLPVRQAGQQPQVISMTLSQFRVFAEIIGPLYSLSEFGHNLGIPLDDAFEEVKCHLSNESFKVLQHVEYYIADPELETVLAGYQCEECGINISEAAREKEKLGGKGGKGIAKAKCPKCEKKMGSMPLYTLASASSEEQAGDGSSAQKADESGEANAATPATATADAPEPATNATAEKDPAETSDKP